LAKKREWDKENTEHRRKYRTANRYRYNAHAMKRYCAEKNATPSWLSQSQEKEIQHFYWLAKDLEAVSGERYDVDHIIPIQGEDVCGLHVPWNLQILPKDLNISKGNRVKGFAV